MSRSLLPAYPASGSGISNVRRIIPPLLEGRHLRMRAVPPLVRERAPGGPTPPYKEQNRAHEDHARERGRDGDNDDPHLE